MRASFERPQLYVYHLLTDLKFLDRLNSTNASMSPLPYIRVSWRKYSCKIIISNILFNVTGIYEFRPHRRR